MQDLEISYELIFFNKHITYTSAFKITIVLSTANVSNGIDMVDSPLPRAD